ncbi:MAG: saccharopine dehydrogenase NADP-binding domain-containing protein [Acidobacteriota bacterium]
MPITSQPTASSLNPDISAKPDRTIAVFGAYGHTGRFVIAELVKRGWTAILSGRNTDKLKAMGAEHRGLEIRSASIDDPVSLDYAFSGAAAVINCAGPFMDTATPVIEAALRARIHYLDVSAEQRPVLAAFEQFADAARDASIVIAPAMAFYGGLSDLLATAAMGDWTAADEINIAIALDSWKPTLGTRLTGKRNVYQRYIFSNNRLQFLADPPPTRTWNFPTPFAKQDMVSIPFSEIITISHHLQTPEICTYINLTPIRDIRDPDTPPPTAADESGRSSQTFLVETVVRLGKAQRRALARGRDIYHITAPIVVEATQRILSRLAKTTGVVAAGEVFDARDFLMSLCPTHLSIEIH